MDYYAVLGMLVVGGIALLTVTNTIRKDAEARQKPLNDLNLNITKLSNSIDRMHDNNVVRDKRIEKTEDKCEELDKRMRESEHELSNHETRILSLENYRNKKEC